MNIIGERTNYLLVIGIDEYQSPYYSSLNNSVFDCRRIQEELINNYDFQLAEEPLYNKDATRENIISVLSRLAYSTMEDDNLIIYYAGHGHMNSFNKGFWVPYDAENNVSHFIPNSQIKDLIEDIPAKHIFLITDSCFSGSFILKNRGNSTDRAYENLDKKKSRWILASGELETVSDGKTGKGSPFNNALLTYLSNNSNKYISILDIIDYVTKSTDSTLKQQPIGGEIDINGHEHGQMVLTKKKITLSEDNIQPIQLVKNEDHFGELMRTYGFYIGQKLTLEKIKTTYPSLENVVFIRELSWQSAFGKSLEHIVESLKSLLKGSWESYEKVLLESIHIKEIDLNEALNFLDEVDERIQGNIPSPIIESLLSNRPDFSESPILEFTKRYRRKLKSIEYAKAKGLDFDMEIPLSWKISDGKRPNVLFLTENYSKDLLSVVVVKKVNDLAGLPSQVWTKDFIKTITDEALNCDQIKEEMSTENTTNFDCKKITIDGCPALTLDYEDKIERAGITLNMYTRMYIISFREYVIHLMFQINKDTIDLQSKKTEYNSLFGMIANSFIINNQYQ